MGPIARASRNQTATQLRATLDPPAAQPQGEQETALTTRAGAGIITKTAAGSIIQEKVPPTEAGASSPKCSLRDLERFVRVGGHLQTTTIKGSPQGQGLPPTPDPGQFKVVQEGAERAEEEQPTLLERKIATGRTRAGEIIDSKTIKMTIQAPKDKKTVLGCKASKLSPGNAGRHIQAPNQGKPHRRQ